MSSTIAPEAVSVRCQNCGSPLKVAANIRFVTCGYCQSELEVVRAPSAIHTEVLQRLEENMAKTSTRLEVIELQQEIDLLDREWEEWKERTLERSKDGRRLEPSEEGILGPLFLAFAGLILIVLNLMGQTVTFGVFGLILVLIGGISAVDEKDKLKDFNQRRAVYLERRAALVVRIDSIKSGRAQGGAGSLALTATAQDQQPDTIHADEMVQSLDSLDREWARWWETNVGLTAKGLPAAPKMSGMSLRIGVGLVGLFLICIGISAQGGVMAALGFCLMLVSFVTVSLEINRINDLRQKRDEHLKRRYELATRLAAIKASELG